MEDYSAINRNRRLKPEGRSAGGIEPPAEYRAAAAIAGAERARGARTIGARSAHKGRGQRQQRATRAHPRGVHAVPARAPKGANRGYIGGIYGVYRGGVIPL